MMRYPTGDRVTLIILDDQGKPVEHVPNVERGTNTFRVRLKT